MEEIEETPFIRLMRWEKALSGADTETAVAHKLGEWPQTLINWKKRGVPTREYGRLAQRYGKTIGMLAGTEPEDDPLLSELMMLWKKLLPETRRNVLGYVKIQRAIQNPAGETGPHPVLPDPDEEGSPKS